MKPCHPPCPHFPACRVAVFLQDGDGWLAEVLPCEREPLTPDAPAPVPPAYRAALAAIAAQPGLNRSQLAATMQTSDAAARHAIGWLQQHGHIINAGSRRAARYVPAPA